MNNDYSVKILYKGPGAWPALKGELYERDMLIAKFERRAVCYGFIPPIVSKFLSTQAHMRFQSFADSLSVEETIEALMGL